MHMQRTTRREVNQMLTMYLLVFWYTVDVGKYVCKKKLWFNEPHNGLLFYSYYLLLSSSSRLLPPILFVMVYWCRSGTSTPNHTAIVSILSLIDPNNDYLCLLIHFTV